MPIIQSAEKKTRKDKLRTRRNTRIESAAKKNLRAARRSPTVKTVNNAFKALDQAAKKGVIHKNKAARLKSRLAKKMKSKK